MLYPLSYGRFVLGSGSSEASDWPLTANLTSKPSISIATMDSIAGPLTGQELLAVQSAHHLAQDGICGPLTSRALGIAVL